LLPGPGSTARDNGDQPDFFAGLEDDVIGEQLAAACGQDRLWRKPNSGNGIAYGHSGRHVVALAAVGEMRPFAVAGHLFILPLRE